MAFRVVDKPFLEYSKVPDYIREDGEFLLLIERFAILLYYASSSAEIVNETRRILFAQRNRLIENIPQLATFFLHHLKLAFLQFMDKLPLTEFSLPGCLSVQIEKNGR